MMVTACAGLFRPSVKGSVDVEIPEWVTERLNRKIKIYNLPLHFIEEFLCGHGHVVNFKYRGSSAIYFCEKVEESPNVDNIERTRTIPALWRMGGWFYSEFKEWVFDSIDNDSVRCDLLLTYNDYYQCTTKDIFDGEPDSSKPLDLRGTDEKNRCWRDVKVDDFCLGYYGVSPSRLAEFDRCIDTTLARIHLQ